ncbi:hypothetical protein BN2476_940009 [Paraburkholderia piptadeniae]|uniref:Uncharacterized protein n=1 Tax=Paraburkholderia piptadeniae TaxID=1701573 RepID=A0A1N7STT4_9BURK|nr:hypothetical protein BN2476_940009 [Paraburkholderia piptadeniae]
MSCSFNTSYRGEPYTLSRLSGPCNGFPAAPCMTGSSGRGVMNVVAVTSANIGLLEILVSEMVGARTAHGSQARAGQPGTPSPWFSHLRGRMYVTT